LRFVGAGFFVGAEGGSWRGRGLFGRGIAVRNLLAHGAGPVTGVDPPGLAHRANVFNHRHVGCGAGTRGFGLFFAIACWDTQTRNKHGGRKANGRPTRRNPRAEGGVVSHRHTWDMDIAVDYPGVTTSPEAGGAGRGQPLVSRGARAGITKNAVHPRCWTARRYSARRARAPAAGKFRCLLPVGGCGLGGRS